MLQRDLTGTFLGTGGYIAPEVRQQKPYSTAVDNWALGVLMYCCLAAKLPFAASMQPLSPHREECRRAFQLTFADEQWKDVSPACKGLIARLLDTDPMRRVTAKEALSDPWVSALFENCIVCLLFVVSFEQS